MGTDPSDDSSADRPDGDDKSAGPTPPPDAPFDNAALDRLHAITDLTIPREIGRYHVIEKIGAGGMGVVLKAEQRTPVRRIVAIKVIKLGLDNKSVTARFEAEQQALAMMDHPNIARVLDAGAIDENRPYFVMEYVPGEPITDYCDRQKLGLKDRLKLFRDMCSAVQHAHTKGIIHRDLKPSNVLICMKEGQPTIKIIDFGLAKALQGRLATQTYFTEFGQLIGTPEYMSPEQAEMNHLDIDTRTDIYGLGVMLYELLTGCLPFDPHRLREAAYAEIQRIIREDAPPRPSVRLSSLGAAATAIAEKRRMELNQLASQLHRELEWIPLKAMRKDRTERYQTAAALEQDVGNYLEGRALTAGPESALYRTRKLFLRNKRVFVASAAGVLLVLAGAGVYITTIRQEQHKTEAALGLAQANAERATRDEARANENAARLAAETKLAKDETARAEANARVVELQLAESLVSQGDAFALAGRWDEAKKNYWAAYDKFGALHVSRFHAEAALCVAHDSAPAPLLALAGHSGPVFGIAVSPDGHTALSASIDKKDHTLRLWDLTTGKQIRTLGGEDNYPTCVAFCPGGHSALSGSLDGTLRLWDLTTGKEIRSLPGHTRGVTHVAISADGRIALSASLDATLKLWDLTGGKEIRTLTGHTRRVTSLAMSPDGHTAVSGSGEAFGGSDSAGPLEMLFRGDHTLRQWDLTTGEETRTLATDAPSIISLAISPDGRTALAGSGYPDSTVDIWDLTTGRKTRTLTGHAGYVSSVAICPDGRTALSGSWDKTLKLWDLATGKEIRSFIGHADRVTSISIGADGRTALSGCKDGTLELWDLTGGREIRTLRGHTNPVWNVAISPGGRIAVSGCDDGTAKVWDLPTGKVLRTLVGHTRPIIGVAIALGGHAALTDSKDEKLKLWDLKTGEVIRTLPGSPDPVRFVAVTRDGLTALSAGGDMVGGDPRTLFLWDLTTGKEILPLAGPFGTIASVAMSEDGRFAFSGGDRGELKLWDFTAGKAIKSFAGHRQLVSGVALSQVGHRAVSGSLDGTLKLWDLTTGKETCVLAGHAGGVTSVAFSPDGQTAVSGSDDRTLKLWDLAGGKEIRTLTGHTREVESVAFSPDGRAVLSGGFDNMLRLWDFSRAPAYLEFDRTVSPAQATLRDKPDDPAAIAVLGNWFAFRGKNDFAVELLERARRGGAAVDPLTLARCYWELSDDLPPGSSLTRADCLAAARREFGNALDAHGDAKDAFYLQLCLAAVGRAAGAATTRTEQ